MALYGTAAVIAAASAARRGVSRLAAAIVGTVAAGWGLQVALTGPLVRAYRHMFDAWEMQSADIEEAREASGLLIVAAWMAVLYLRARRASGTVTAIDTHAA
jgi:hypothetical protein